jgi:hypothetical protein
VNRCTLRSRLAVRALLLAAGIGPVSVSAQTDTPDPVVIVNGIPAGRSLRIDVARVGRIEGRFVSRTASGLTLHDGVEATHIIFDDIERLWVRGRSTGRGAVIGGAVGLVLGLATGLALSEVVCGADGGSCTGLGFSALGGLAGGVSGGLVGAGVGAWVPRWRLRFP